MGGAQDSLYIQLYAASSGYRVGRLIESITQRFDDDQWHQAVITRNNTEIKLYTDGQLLQESSDSDSIYDTSIPLRIGGGSGTSASVDTARRLLGRISEVLVYEKSLTAAEVLQNFNATKDRFGL